MFCSSWSTMTKNYKLCLLHSTLLIMSKQTHLLFQVVKVSLRQLHIAVISYKHRLSTKLYVISIFNYQVFTSEMFGNRVIVKIQHMNKILYTNMKILTFCADDSCFVFYFNINFQYAVDVSIHLSCFWPLVAVFNVFLQKKNNRAVCFSVIVTMVDSNKHRQYTNTVLLTN